jgi:hypothetical protein
LQRYYRRLRVVTKTIDLKSLDGADDVVIWEWIHQVLLKLGDGGMSSDESDIDKNTDMNLYHIKSLPWRRNLDIVMGMIDKQRLKDKDLYSAQGAKPGLRVRGVRNIESTRDIPPGIPEVLIKQEWLGGKSVDERRRLRISTEQMDWINLTG